VTFMVEKESIEKNMVIPIKYNKQRTPWQW
jgi:hypothetical protein